MEAPPIPHFFANAGHHCKTGEVLDAVLLRCQGGYNLLLGLLHLLYIAQNAYPFLYGHILGEN